MRLWTSFAMTTAVLGFAASTVALRGLAEYEISDPPGPPASPPTRVHCAALAFTPGFTWSRKYTLPGFVELTTTTERTHEQPIGRWYRANLDPGAAVPGPAIWRSFGPDSVDLFFYYHWYLGVFVRIPLPAPDRPASTAGKGRARWVTDTPELGPLAVVTVAPVPCPTRGRRAP